MVMLLQHWLQTKTQREKLILSWGGVIAILLLIYAYLWLPLSNNLAQQRALYLNHITQLQWMQQHQRIAPINNTHDNILITVERAIVSSHLSSQLNDVDQSGTHQISLHFNGVGFHALMQMLQTLWTQQGIFVRQIKLSQTTLAGTVQGAVTLAQS